MGQRPKKFSEFATEEPPLAGDKLKLDDILNKEIMVTGYKVRESKYSKKNSQTCLAFWIKSCDIATRYPSWRPL